MSLRDRDLAPDEKGRYRRRIGWIKRGKDSDAVQPRFNLGTEPKEAELRYRRIQALYEDCCRLEKGVTDEWDYLAYEFAKQLAAGHTTVSLDPDTWTPEKSFDEIMGRTPRPLRYECLDYARFVEFVREAYPSVGFVPSNLERYERSLKRNQAFVADELKEFVDAFRAASVPLAKGQVPTALIPGTLHEGLDAYSKSIERDGARLESANLKPYQRTRLGKVARLKATHPDIPLFSLTSDKCKEMVSIWRNRPKTQKGVACSRSHAKNQLGELRRFFQWLDQTTEFEWSMPKNVADLSCKIEKFGSDRPTSVITVETYTPAQLAVINQHAKPLERLCLYLALNCGMGAAELGRIKVKDFDFPAPHPYADALHFASSESDRFLTLHRPKTDVFGQWLLWPEVFDVVRRGIERAEEAGSEVLFVRETGKPMYDENSENPQFAFANLWNRLLDRVQKSHDDFPRLPFGSLRDTLPSALRHRYSGELASLCLAHGSPCKTDVLLERYAGKPFGRFFTAVRELRAFYAPVFAAVTDPFDATKHYLPIERKHKVRTLLAEGKGVAEVVRACGVSRATVYRERAVVERQSQNTWCVQPDAPQVEKTQAG